MNHEITPDSPAPSGESLSDGGEKFDQNPKEELRASNYNAHTHARELYLENILQTVREGLVTTTAANPLLNFRPRSSGKGLIIQDERSDEVFSILVKKQQPMGFAFAEDGSTSESKKAYPLPLSSSRSKKSPYHRDQILFTPYSAEELHERLFELERSQKFSLQEKGMHALYLVLATLRWTDPQTGKKLCSPLLSISVDLKRDSIKDEYYLVSTGQEIEENVSLRKRFEELHYPFPDLPPTIKLNPVQYCRTIHNSLRDRGDIEFTVYPDEISLRLLNFASYGMYGDLDVNNWPEGKKPVNHPLIRQLFLTGFEKGNEIDSSRSSQTKQRAEKYNVLQCDAAQRSIINELSSGQSYLIKGPPGTGKTTTMVNIAVTAAHQGKRVLAYFKKQAAADVFARYLSSRGQEHFYVDTHGNMSKLDIYRQFDSILNQREPKPPEGREELCQELDSLENRLEKHRSFLSQRVGESGFTAYEVFANAIALRGEEKEYIPFNSQTFRDWDQPTFERALQFAERLQHFHLAYGPPGLHPLRDVGSQKTSALERSELEKHLQQLSTVASLLSQESAALKKKSKLAIPPSFLGLHNFLSVLSCAQIIGKYDESLVKKINFLHKRWRTEPVERLQLAAAKELEYAQLRERYGGGINFSELKTCNLAEIKSALDDFEKRNILIRTIFPGSYRTALDKLQQVCLPPRLISDIRKRISILELLQQKESEVTQLNSLWDSLLSMEPEGMHRHEPAFWLQISLLIPIISEFVGSENADSYWNQIRERIQSGIDLAECKDEVERLAALQNDMREIWAKIQVVLNFSEDHNKAMWEEIDLCDLPSRLDDYRRSLPQLDMIEKYNSLTNEYETLNPELKEIAQSSKSEQTADRDLVDSFRYSYFMELQHLLESTDHHTRQFSGDQHDEHRRRFEAGEKRLLDLNAQLVSQYHFKNLPRAEAGGQAEVLANEAQKRAGNLTPRELGEKCGRAVFQAAPIVIASPHSTEMHLSPSAWDFDLVLIDELSQMPLAEAFCGILRGKQFLGYCDEKQLGPTSFWGSLPEVTLPSPSGESWTCRSALDLFTQAGMPTLQLNTAYRFHRPGAIMLSNEEFYDRRLNIFPSSEVGNESDGLEFHYVKNGVYEKNGTNPNEAHALIKGVHASIRTFPNQPIIVITANEAQMKLLDRLLEKLRFENEEVEAFFRRFPCEQLVVKNIETVQGDERANVFISTTYGPNEAGNFSINFGPINQDGGANRVNVMMTRYQQKNIIYTSMLPEWPEFERSEAKGVRVLRRLLDWAKNGSPLNQTRDERPLDPLQCYLKGELEKSGYEVHTNIGPAGTGVDIGVLNPKDPGRYIVGIQTDGSRYQSVENTSERESIFSECLKKRGWDLYFIWSLDWLKAPREKMSELLEYIDKVRRAESLKTTDSIGSFRESYEIIRERRQTKPEYAVPYKLSNVDFSSFSSLYDSEPQDAQRDLRRLLKRVVQSESPISKNFLYSRLRKLSGKRDSTKLAEMYDTVYQELLSEDPDILADGDFLLMKDALSLPRDRSELARTDRVFSDIHSSEIDKLLNRLVQDSCGITEENLIQSAIRGFGYSRAPRFAEDIVRERIAQLVESETVKFKEGEYFVLS